MRIFHKVVIITSPTNREANAKGFVMLKNTYSEKIPMENKHFIYPSLSLLFSQMLMLKESIAYGIFSTSLPTKVNKKHTFASLILSGQLLTNQSDPFRIVIQPSDLKDARLRAGYPSAQAACEPQT